MAYVTYENSWNPHVTIHANGCGQIAKRGGEHKHGQGAYHDHATYEDAKAYAKSTDLPVKDRSYCKPGNQ